MEHELPVPRSQQLSSCLVSHINAVYALSSHLFKSHFNIKLPLGLGLLQVLSFPRVFHPKFCTKFCSFSHAPSAHTCLILIDSIIRETDAKFCLEEAGCKEKDNIEIGFMCHRARTGFVRLGLGPAVDS
jgi:hypothetical protein